MNLDNMEFVKCTKCGWVHFVVSSGYIDEAVRSFNDYYDTLPQDQQNEWYGGRKSSFNNYCVCSMCGASYKESKTCPEHDVPRGSTISPILDPSEDVSI